MSGKHKRHREGKGNATMIANGQYVIIATCKKCGRYPKQVQRGSGKCQRCINREKKEAKDAAK